MSHVTTAKTYATYWHKKQLLNSKPHFPCVQWLDQSALCDIESIYFATLQSAKSILDVGAGDLRIKKKFEAAGFSGEYHTLDIGDEHAHTYTDITQVKRKYAAVICLDVIEHLPLPEGLALMEKILNAVEENGVLIIQTPNARCVRSALANDMTHLHLYNLSDLWSHFTAKGHQVDGYRIVLGKPRGVLQKIESLLSKYIITRLLGLDYADNIAVVVRKKIRAEGKP